jgi:hypothetical protein
VVASDDFTAPPNKKVHQTVVGNNKNSSLNLHIMQMKLHGVTAIARFSMPEKG